MPGVRLICWNEDLARERCELLRRAGFEVNGARLEGSGFVKHFRECAPEAVVIDLDRLPSHGREVGAALRVSKTTRSIPLVFVGGPPAKVQRIRDELPDAVYTDWSGVAGAIRRAVEHPPTEPVAARPHMERYAHSGLAKKLGIKAGNEVALLGAPEKFEGLLHDRPEGVAFTDAVRKRTALALWFVRSRRELDGECGYITARLPRGCHLWLIHPKRSSRYPVDFTQNDVRIAGLAAGWVDYKVCKVDEDWSGLKFAPRAS